MSDIPSDIFRDILLRLPADSLLRFRSVCKSWRALIDDPSFVKSHTNNQLSSNTLLIRNRTGAPLFLISLDALDLTASDRQTIDAIPIKQLIRRGVPRLGDLPVAACNGLILISSSDIKKIWAIWNPLTRECRELPQFNTDALSIKTGIGYDDAADDYKVVRIDSGVRKGRFVHKTHVYSLKLGYWRLSNDCPYDTGIFGKGVFLNGALHWASKDGIIAFDLGTETFRILPLPAPEKYSLKPFEVCLDAVGGCLILSYYHFQYKGWVMEKYGVRRSWKKLFSLNEYDIIGDLSTVRPVAYLRDKGQVFLQHDMGLFWISIEDGSVQKVGIHGHSGISSAQIFHGSLFRLGDSGSVASQAVTGVKRKRVTKKKRKQIRLTFCVRDFDDMYCSDLSCYSPSSSDGWED